MQKLRVEDFTFTAEKKGGRHVIVAPSTHELEFKLKVYADKPIGVELVYEPPFADVDEPTEQPERVMPLVKDNVIDLVLRTDRLVRVELVQPANAQMAVKADFRELTGETKVFEQVYIHPPSYQERALQHMVRNAVAEMVGEQPEEADPMAETEMEWDEDDFTTEDNEFGEGYMEEEEEAYADYMENKEEDTTDDGGEGGEPPSDAPLSEETAPPTPE